MSAWSERGRMSWKTVSWSFDRMALMRPSFASTGGRDGRSFFSGCCRFVFAIHSFARVAFSSSRQFSAPPSSANMPYLGRERSEHKRRARRAQKKS
jgi:hypothetical protein